MNRTINTNFATKIYRLISLFIIVAYFIFFLLAPVHAESGLFLFFFYYADLLNIIPCWLISILTLVSGIYLVLSLYDDNQKVKKKSFILLLITYVSWIIYSFVFMYKDITSNHGINPLDIVFVIIFILLITGECILFKLNKEKRNG